MSQDTKEWIKSLWNIVDAEEGPYDGTKREAIGIYGRCHDCGCDVSFYFDRECNVVDGHGGVWHFEDIPTAFVKCGECFEKDDVLRNYQPCEVYSRVVGYLRPVRQWNAGKKAEYIQRVEYDMNKATKGDNDG